MNARPNVYRLLGSLAVLAISSLAACADDSVATNTTAVPVVTQPVVVVQTEIPVAKPESPAPNPPSAPETWHVPYGAQDILTLTRAQIGETLVINFIQNSGTIYNLQAMDIVHLRDQGVSEHIIGAMLDQKARVIAEAKVETPPTPAPNTAAGTSVNVYAAPLIQPAVFGLPTALPEPQSMLHIIPYRAASYAYRTSYRPFGFRPYFNYSPAYYGGWCGGYSSVTTIHSGFGSHSPTRRGWR